MLPWADTFFSGNPPSFADQLEQVPNFGNFSPDTNKWYLGQLVDKSRPIDATRIQVLWLRMNGRKDLVAKVFPDYTPGQAAQQLRRLHFSESQIRSLKGDAQLEFDSFYREARAYSHIERFCPASEQIYFPRYHGVLTDLERSRFPSGYVHPRAVVLEAIKPGLRSRRILAADGNRRPDSFQPDIPMSSFEREWYWSLQCDRLRRLAALHSIGITHGDVHDHHFRLPGDSHDTVLYDFSASYTPRPLKRVSDGERQRVELQVQTRVEKRDFRTYLVESAKECETDDALYRSLDEKEELLEAIILKVWTRPDFPSFPFLEEIRPEDDSTWHIRRGRLLDCYEAAWASFLSDEPSLSIIAPCYYLLCLVPREWDALLRQDAAAKESTGHDRLRQCCLRLISSEGPVTILKRLEFFSE
ncbi:hypothetical protein BJY04DRAFT_232670 [Aspergillus karnatakaensis]|uniref:uncharacterized protein n=1 Tax=Aspergillus karnatakaensis TaxID=1810916 RepID=UPI003CCE3419